MIRNIRLLGAALGGLVGLALAASLRLFEESPMGGPLLVAWVVLNSLVLARRGEAFDPYPYILLNLFLSMTAALQAPVIMMSQNRMAARDRLEAAHDYEVNLMAEVEIRTLHDKLDQLRDRDWASLVAQQQEQIRLLERLLERAGESPAR